jgi:hypothetical protein
MFGWAGSMVQVVENLQRKQRALNSKLVLPKANVWPDMVVHICNPSALKVKAVAL